MTFANMFRWVGCLMAGLFATALCTASAVAAPNDQLWFVGKRGALDAFGPGAGAVHLQWGVTEGALPADVAAFEVDFEGETIHTTPAHPRPAAAAVEAAYAASPRHRQLMMARLDAAGVAGTLGTALAARIGGPAPSDRYWRREAGRQDPILAQLSGRGLVHRDGAAGTYTLFAVARDGRRAELGAVEIDARPRPAAPPADVRQVTGLSRCDAPERGRQHGVVALTWDLAGARGSVDRFAYTLDLAGYDVFRATAPGEVQDLDFAALSLAAGADATGEPRLEGLVRINKAPIAPTPAPVDGAEARYQGWNPDFAQWTETAEAIARAGLKPGDRRAYYVVPRDRTGAYGRAVGLMVTVPDMLAPAAPSGVQAHPVQTADHAADAIRLTWWHVDARNRYDADPGRQWCNLPTAAAEGRLTFAGKDGDCVTPAGQIGVDVTAYRIFRFDDQVTAAEFVDTDADGVPDSAERQVVGPKLSRPGTACDPDRQPPGAQSALVAEVTTIDRRNGRAVVEFSDPLTPTVRRGNTYWYRVAAIGRNGQVSALSAPVRGFFPNLDKPARLSPDAMTFGQCSMRAEAVQPSGTNALDLTGIATEAEFYCLVPEDGPRPVFGGEPIGGGFERRLVATAPIIDLPDGRRGTAAPDLCEAIPADCNLMVQFVAANGQPIAATPIPEIGREQGCDFTARLAQDCSEPRPIDDGGTFVGPLIFRAGADGPCIDLFRTVAGRRYRMTTLCPNDLWVSDPRPLDGALACYSMEPVNDQGIAGTVTPLGCFRPVETEPPEPPQITSLTFDGQTGEVQWRSPAQVTGGVLLEWRHVDGTLRAATYAGHGGRYGPFESHEHRFGVPPLGDFSQRWCVRGRSFGRGGDVTGMVSDWSPETCVERSPPATPLPVYLEWPTVPRPAELGALPVRYLEPDRVTAIALSSLSQSVINEGECANSFGFPKAACGGEDNCVDDWPRLYAGCDICSRVEARLGANRRFVVYRQRRDADGTLHPFVQVSERVDGMFCNPSCNDPFGCECPNNQPCGAEVDPYGFCLFPEQAEARCAPGQTPQGVFDPYIKLLAFPDGDAWPRITLAFVDRTPHASDTEYRYQLVYFDAQGEITGRRTTDFIQTPSEGAL